MNLQSSIDKNVQQKNVLLSQATTLVQRGLNPQNQSQYDRLMRSVDELEATIAQQRKLVSKQSDHSFAPAAVSPIHADAQNRALTNKAFATYFRTGVIDALQKRDINTSSAGALIPEEFQNELYARAAFFGPVASLVSRKLDDGVRPTLFPVVDDTANGYKIITESTTTDSAVYDSAFVKDATLSDALVSRLTASFQLIDDAFDIQKFLDTVFAQRVGRSLEKAITTGTDFFGNALPNNVTGGLVGQTAVGVTTAALADGIGYADIENLLSNLDESYRIAPTSGVMMHWRTRDYLQGQKDGEGRPYFSLDGQKKLTSILGIPVVINSAMPAPTFASGSYTFAASTKYILAGDYSKAYGVSLSEFRVKRIMEFPGLAEQGLVTFLSHFRVGSTSLLSDSVTALKTAAS